MDKIYEQKGLMLRQAFAELPLDVSLNMKNLSNVLNTDPEAVFSYVLQRGLVQAWDLIAGDREEALEPIQIDAKVVGVSPEFNEMLWLQFHSIYTVGQLGRNVVVPGTLITPFISVEKQKAFLDKEVTITIALKGIQMKGCE